MFDMTVTLISDVEEVCANVKYRNGFQGNTEFTTTTVSNGNFSNRNLFCDNTVELNCTYGQAMISNFIKLSFGNYNIIGAISDRQYINDNNVNISYKVDPFHSAIESNLIKNLHGLCERTHLDYTDTQSFVNLNSEPFSMSDCQRADPITTAALNAAVIAFEGIPQSPNAVSGNGTQYVLTVSPAIVVFCNISSPFSHVSNPSPELKNSTNFNFFGTDNFLHSGGIYRGYPISFSSMTDVSSFIAAILGGCGFRTELSPDGYDSQQATTHLQYNISTTGGDGSVSISGKNAEADPIESIRFITGEDIYNLYMMPNNFADPNEVSFEIDNIEIDTMPTLSGFTGFGAEDNSKSKLLAYPYSFKQVLTANGDGQTLIPQSANQRDGVWANQNKIILNMKYIGGDCARLLGRFVPQFAGLSPYDADTNGEWFTIRSYPSLTLSINNTYNAQIQRETAQIRRNSALYANSVQNSQLSSPLKQGYLDGVGGMTDNNVNAGTGTKMLYGLGNSFGNYSNMVQSFDTNSAKDDSLFNKQVNQDVTNANRAQNAGNFITPDVQVISGNDFMSQLTAPPFVAYSRGGSQSELFGACRYFDMFGQSTNCILNPLTNEGDIMAGKAFVSNYEYKTYYQFAYIDIAGDMPIDWKNKIKVLFESGVYLI